jgi:hypothetical protein
MSAFGCEADIQISIFDPAFHLGKGLQRRHSHQILIGLMLLPAIGGVLLLETLRANAETGESQP